METEEEQVERLKKWLKENGMSIVAGIVIGVGGLAGYRYWEAHKQAVAEQASSEFTLMIAALEQGKSEDVQSRAQTLIDEYASSEYATLAKLALARNALAAAEFEKAEAFLGEVVESEAEEPLAYVARTRLAMVQLQRQQYEQALATLDAEFPQAFIAQVDELRGDILTRKGDNAAAIEAYKRAMQAEPKPANPGFLQQKLEELGVTG